MRKKRLLKYIIPSLTMILGIIIAVIGISVGAKEDYIKQLNLTDIQAVVRSGRHRRALILYNIY